MLLRRKIHKNLFPMVKTQCYVSLPLVKGDQYHVDVVVFCIVFVVVVVVSVVCCVLCIVYCVLCVVLVPVHVPTYF